MDANQIAAIVRFHRKKSGLSQAELAKLAALGKTVIFDIRLLAKLHLIIKMALFGIFFEKFFDHMYTYALKISRKICSKIAHFSNQSEFCKKSIEKGKLSIRLDTLLKVLDVLNIKIEFQSQLMVLFKESVE